MPSAPNLRKAAIRLVATGIGSAVAGPIGAAMGASLGGLFSNQAEKLLENYAHASAEVLSEFGVHYCYDQLRDMREHPPLEAVVRESLRIALADIGAAAAGSLQPTHSDWFANWEWRLNGSNPAALDSLSEIVKLSTSSTMPELDTLFRRTMERRTEKRAHIGRLTLAPVRPLQRQQASARCPASYPISSITAYRRPCTRLSMLW